MRRSSSTSSTTSSTMAPQRASWISVTFLRQPNVDGATLLWDCAGVDLCLNRCQGQVMVMSTKEDCAATRHLQVGDVLDSINGRSCHNVEITDVWGMVDGSIEIAAPEEEETVVTTEDTETTNETAEETKTNIDETTTTPNEVASEPSDNADETDNKSADNGLITLTFHCAEGCSGMVCAVAIPPADAAGSSISNYPPFSLGLTLTEQEDQPPRRRLRRTVSTTKSLVITEIIKDRWMAQSALNLGDSLLSVNDNVTNGCSLDEVVALISKEIGANNSITILAKPGADSNNNNNQRGARWQKVRRASAKVGGGLMVTTGAVLMVTPLHPVGHAMAIGGVAVLGGLGRKKKKQEEGDDDDKAGDAIDEKATDDDDSSSQEAEADKDGTPDTPKGEELTTKEESNQDTPAAPRKIIVEAV